MPWNESCIMFRLRALRPDDEALILQARNSDSVRLFMQSQAIIPAEVHARWMAAKLADTQAPYFLFLQDSKPIGVVGITHFVADTHSGEWGFYIFVPDAPKGAGTAMLATFLDIMFAKGLLSVKAVVFTHNMKSQRLHAKLGFSQKSVILGETPDKELTVWQLSAAQWRLTKPAFAAIIETVNVEQI